MVIDNQILLSFNHFYAMFNLLNSKEYEDPG